MAARAAVTVCIRDKLYGIDRYKIFSLQYRKSDDFCPISHTLIAAQTRQSTPCWTAFLKINPGQKGGVFRYVESCA